MAVFGSRGVSGKIPWFMFDIDNRQLITSPVIPSDISDTKEIIFAEQPVPGRGFAPVAPSGANNRRLSFTLQLIKRDGVVGNLAMLKQFDMLRHSSAGVFGRTRERFRNPKVLYYWGTGSVPLVYWVARADATHKQGWVNDRGIPQYSEIQIELILDQTSQVYKMEEQFRQIASFLGNFDLPGSLTGGRWY
jgi:hypothetical protein